MSVQNKRQKVWGYTSSFSERLIGLMSKKHFVKQAVEIYGDPKNWINKRTCQTYSFEEIRMATEAPGKCIKISC